MVLPHPRVEILVTDFLCTDYSSFALLPDVRKTHPRGVMFLEFKSS